MDRAAVREKLDELSDEAKSLRVSEYLRETDLAYWQKLLESATWELILQARAEAQRAYEADQAEIDGTFTVQVLGGAIFEIERRPRQRVADIKATVSKLFPDRIGKLCLLAGNEIPSDDTSVAALPLELLAVWKTNWLMAACASPEDRNKELLFFFQDQRWIIWDFDTDKVAYGPSNLHETGRFGWFEQLPSPFSKGFDAVVQDPLGAASQYLFFSGDLALRWCSESRASVGEALSMRDLLPLLPESFEACIDAAVPVPCDAPNSLLLSKGGRWVAYDMTSHEVKEADDSPLADSLSRKLHRLESLPQPFSFGVDAAVRRPGRLEKELIIFSRDQWMLFDYAPDRRGDNTHGPHKVTEMWMANISALMGTKY